jgi:transcriptional regulator with XRE-family HTH domain
VPRCRPPDGPILAIGRLFRELRVRLGWRAVDVASRAAVSLSAYSLIERRVSAVLEVRLALDPRSRGAEVDRLLSSRHAAMFEAVTRLLPSVG